VLKKAKYFNFNKTQLDSDTEKVKLTRKKILNDEELKEIIEEGGILGFQREDNKFN